MKATRSRLLAILLAGLVLRLMLLSLAHNPGLHDPVHYYNLGRRISQGHGLTINYIWHYSRLPQDVVHQIDHWMPMAGIAAAVGISLGGDNPQAAASVFVLAGALLPLLVYGFSKKLDLSDASALMAAAFGAFLPDLVYSSLRTDTTILNAIFVCLALYLLNDALQRDRWSNFLLSGVLAGLAYLTRNDSLLLLPVSIFVITLHTWMSPERWSLRRSGKAFILIAAAFTITTSPWLIRNQQELGMLGTAESSRMFFMVEHHDHYAYGIPITLESMLQRHTPAQLIAKRFFELLAALKQIGTSLGLPLFLLTVGGLGWLIRKRDQQRLLMLAPAFLWLLGIVVAYPILLPVKSQAGSFEKAFLSILPLLLPLAALALERMLRKVAYKRVVVAVLVLGLAYGSFEFVRQETSKADLYYDSMAVLVNALDDLPDRTGDQRTRVMAQDPFVLSYLGVESIMIPLASREDTVELAQRYDIDYLMMPPGRPALDALYLGQESDERFVLAAHLPEAGAKPFQLYQFRTD